MCGKVNKGDNVDNIDISIDCIYKLYIYYINYSILSISLYNVDKVNYIYILPYKVLHLIYRIFYTLLIQVAGMKQ